jgi:hypothetical protein
MPRLKPKSRRAPLWWGLLFFLALQLGFNVIVDWRYPELYDAEFGVRLQKYRAWRKEHPDHASLIVLGSSRVVMSFAPEMLPELRQPNGTVVTPFNFAHLGAGPAMNLMQYRRQRRWNVKPDYLVVEVMPPVLSEESPTIAIGSATAPDLPTLHRHVDRGKLYGRYLLRRLVPWYRNRGELLHRVAPDWVLTGEPSERDRISLGRLGGDLFWQVRSAVSAEVGAQYMQGAHDGYAPRLQQFAIRPEATRAYEELLRECRHDGVPVVLVLTPEGDKFRSWYPPQALAEIDVWCADLHQRHGVWIVDARRWLAEEDFVDSHHVLLRGMRRFTLRLHEEVLGPLVAGGKATSAGVPEQKLAASK